MAIHSSRNVTALIALTALSSAACKKKSSSDPDPAPAPEAAVSSTGTDSGNSSTTPLTAVSPYKPGVLPGTLSISFPNYFLSQKPAASLHLASGVPTSTVDLNAAASASTPNGISQLVNSAVQIVDALSGTMYDAMLVDSNWDKVSAFCGESFETCHIPAGSINYAVTPEVLAAVVDDVGGIKEGDGAGLKLDDSGDPYASSVEPGYEAIYGEMFAEANKQHPNPETFIWLSSGGDNPCDAKVGHGIRFQGAADSSSQTSTICWDPATNASITEVSSKNSYEVDGSVTTDGYKMTVSNDPTTKKSVFSSTFFGSGYNTDAQLTLSEDDTGLTIQGLTSAAQGADKTSLNQSAFIDKSGNGFVRSDVTYSSFTVASATADFTTEAGQWYEIFPANANRNAVNSIGGFLGSGTTEPGYTSFTGLSNALSNLDVYACSWQLTSKLSDGVGYDDWQYECTKKGKVTLTGSETSDRYIFKEFFGEKQGWQCIDPATGDIMQASSSEFMDAAVPYEDAAKDAIDAATSSVLTATLPPAALADLTDDDSDDEIDKSGGTFFIIACSGACAATIVQDDSTVVNEIGQATLGSQDDGTPGLKPYIWGDLSAGTPGLYYLDYAQLSAAGYPALVLVAGAQVSVTTN